MHAVTAPASTSRTPAIADGAARARVIAAAGDLFYARGIRSVGMDTVSKSAGVGLKRLYQLFGSKEGLLEQVFAVRHETWARELDAAVSSLPAPRDQLLAIFDFLGDWFSSTGFRGCLFINTFGELGGDNPQVVSVTRAHKDHFQRVVAGLAADAGAPPELARQLSLLAEGAQTTAAISGSNCATDARAAAVTLIDAALRAPAR